VWVGLCLWMGNVFLVKVFQQNFVLGNWIGGERWLKWILFETLQFSEWRILDDKHSIAEVWDAAYTMYVFEDRPTSPPPTPSSPSRATKCAFSKICRPTPSPVWPMCVFEDRLTPSTPSFPCMWHQMCVFDLPAPSQPLPCVRLRPGNWKWQSYKRTFFCDDFKDIVEGWVLDFLIKTFFLIVMTTSRGMALYLEGTFAWQFSRHCSTTLKKMKD